MSVKNLIFWYIKIYIPGKGTPPGKPLLDRRIRYIVRRDYIGKAGKRGETRTYLEIAA